MINNEEIAYGQNEHRTDTSFWSIHGRMRRKDYAFLMIPSLLIYSVSELFLTSLTNKNPMFISIMSLISFTSIVFMIFLGIKRLHDCNYRGWWILIPFVNFAIFFVSGTKGNNRFGADPRLNDSYLNHY